MAGCRPETRCRKRRRVNQGEAATMNPILELLGRRLRLAVIGGGPGSFIGPVHRTAARLDDRFEIVAGVLSGDPTRSRKAAAGIGVAPDRAYGDWPALLAGERARGDGADAVAVMTPNDSHHAICAAALEQGFDVICDKPLDDLARRRGRPRAAGARERARVLPDPQLHRLPDGPAGARHGPRRRHRRRCARSSWLRPGPQRHAGGRGGHAQLALRSRPPAARP